MNKQLSFKTNFLNVIRELAKLPFIENLLVKKTQGKPLTSVFTKLIPNYYQYQSGSKRLAIRDGITYELDISDYIEYIIYYGINVEPREKIYNLIKNGDIVFDIGANVGETLLNISKRNAKGLTIGFEPVPYIYQRLKKNLTLNALENIIIENIALSNESEMLSFSLPQNRNSGGIYMKKTVGTPTSNLEADQKVKAIKLDDFMNENPNITKLDFIKMDIEGFEMNVLLGAHKTIHKYKPKMFIEVDNQMLIRENSSAKKMYDFISNLGYRIINAENDMPLDSTYIFEENCHFDIICLPNSN